MDDIYQHLSPGRSPAEVATAMADRLSDDASAWGVFSNLNQALALESLQRGERLGLGDIVTEADEISAGKPAPERAKAVADAVAGLMIPGGLKTEKEVAAQELGASNRDLLNMRRGSVQGWDDSFDKHKRDSGLSPMWAELMAGVWTRLERGPRPEGRAYDLEESAMLLDLIQAAYLKEAMAREQARTQVEKTTAVEKDLDRHGLPQSVARQVGAYVADQDPDVVLSNAPRTLEFKASEAAENRDRGTTHDQLESGTRSAGSAVNQETAERMLQQADIRMGHQDASKLLSFHRSLKAGERPEIGKDVATAAQRFQVLESSSVSGQHYKLGVGGRLDAEVESTGDLMGLAAAINRGKSGDDLHRDMSWKQAHHVGISR